jgi:excisionase family DNA binding protein
MFGGGGDSVRELLTIKQVAKLLGVSVDTVRHLVWANQINYIDLNRGGRYATVRFRPEHLEEFLREREVQAG